MVDIVLHTSDTGSSDGIDLFTPRFSAPTWWTLWSTFLSSHISLLMAIYLCYRYRSPGPLFPMFITSAKAANIPPALTYGNIATMLPTVFKSLHSTSTITSDRTVIIDFLTVVILALLVVILLTIWFYRFWSHRHTLYVVLEIGNFCDCVRIRCMPLKSVVYAYQFSASGYMESLLTSGVFPSYLSIQWPTFTATHIAKGKIFPFPGKIRISPWTKRRIRKIIRHQDFYALPLLEFNGNFRLLDLATDESLRERSVIASATGRSLADQPNLSEQAVTVPLPTTGLSAQ